MKNPNIEYLKIRIKEIGINHFINIKSIMGNPGYSWLPVNGIYYTASTNNYKL